MAEKAAAVTAMGTLVFESSAALNAACRSDKLNGVTLKDMEKLEEHVWGHYFPDSVDEPLLKVSAPHKTLMMSATTCIGVEEWIDEATLGEVRGEFTVIDLSVPELTRLACWKDGEWTVRSGDALVTMVKASAMEVRALALDLDDSLAMQLFEETQEESWEDVMLEIVGRFQKAVFGG